MLKRTVVLAVLAASLVVPGAASASHDFLPPTSYASAPPRTVYVEGTLPGVESSARSGRPGDGSPWIGTAPDGSQWTFSFGVKGTVFYNIGAGAQQGKWIQPLSIFLDTTPVLVPAVGQPAIVNLTHCTMIWNTNVGPILMVRQ